VALSQARQYYSEVAQDWELQAMIKARHSAGDAALSREFIRGVEPYVYHPDVNFVAVKTALQSRERFDRRGSGPLTRGLARGRIDVKLDRGGIRDIEFLVQCLQRQYGGSETWLRSRGTLFALQKLHDKGHLSGNDFHNLNSAYEFLRHLEHRLQLRQGRQSHQLPNRQSDLKELSTCLNRDGSLVSEPDRFVLQVRRQMEAVVAIYRRIIFQEQSHQLVDPRGNFSLQAQSPSTVEDSFSQIMHRLAVDSPRLLDSISRADLSQHARLNLDRFFRSASASSERYTAILNSPESVERALAVFEDSEYLTNILVRFPAEVTLLDGVDDQPPNEATATLFDLTPERRAVVPDPVLTDLSESKIARAEALASVRQWFRHSLFASGARDMCQQRGVFEALKVNTSAADKAVQAALAIAEPPPGFAVMAVGRLGSCEFDLLSDADILFVADDACDRDSVRRTAERIVDYLTAYTRDGTLFPVDTRLRPQGREGELVTTPERLARYFQRDAQPWEALTFLRLRLIAGDIVVGEQAIAVVREGIAEIAQRPGFDRELVEMRQRLELRDPDQNLKSGPGGTYDIDFLAGRYQAKHRLWEAGNLVNRLSLLRHRGLLAEEEYEVLSRNAELLRSVEHFVRLVTGLPRKWLPVAKHARDSVEKLMTRWALYDKSRSLNDVLDEITRQTRSICLNHRI
jgi:glutamate-ammonia-ligase adenylyltransferase